MDHNNSFIIRHNQSIKTKSVTQQVSQDRLRGSHQLTIYLRIGVHHRHKPCISNSCLKRCHVNFPQVTGTQMNWTAVKPPLRKCMPNKMFTCCHHPVRRIVTLKPLNVCLTKLADHTWIFSKGFFNPSPTRITSHIQNRCQPLTGTHSEHLLADLFSHFFGEIRLKSTR